MIKKKLFFLIEFYGLQAHSMSTCATHTVPLTYSTTYAPSLNSKSVYKRFAKSLQRQRQTLTFYSRRTDSTERFFTKSECVKVNDHNSV